MSINDGAAKSGGWINLPGVGRVHHSVRNPKADATLPYEALYALSAFNKRRFALLVQLAKSNQLDIDDERLDGLVQALAKKPITEGRPEGEIANVIKVYGGLIAAFSHVSTWNDLTINGIECNPTLYSDVDLRTAVNTLRAHLETARLLAEKSTDEPAPTPQSQLDEFFGQQQAPAPAPSGSLPTVPGMAVKYDYRQKDSYADGQIVEIDIAKIERVASKSGVGCYKFYRANMQHPERMDIYEDNERTPEGVKQFLSGLRLAFGGSVTGSYKVVFQISVKGDKRYWNIQSIS